MEETTEIIAYLAAGVMIGALIIAMLSGWRFGKDIKTLEGARLDQKDLTFAKVDKETYPLMVQEFWSTCNHTNETVSYYVYNTEDYLEGNMTKEFMFDIYKSLNWCRSIQSKNNSCGVREDVNMSTIRLPKIVIATCDNSTLHIE